MHFFYFIFIYCLAVIPIYRLDHHFISSLYDKFLDHLSSVIELNRNVFAWGASTARSDYDKPSMPNCWVHAVAFYSQCICVRIRCVSIYISITVACRVL